MGEYGFPSRETSGRITTRLGEEDRLIELAVACESPFGTRIRAVKIPHWMARGVPDEPIGAAELLVEGRPRDGLRLIVADAQGKTHATFVYDRLGLRAELARGSLMKEELADE